MLTAMGEDNNKIQGLKTGADDYVSKPFEPEELYLRIINLLKLYETLNQSELKIVFGEYIFYTKTNALKKNNKELYLTEGENNLLLKLVNKRNDILSREELADKEFDESELRKVDVGITRVKDSSKQKGYSIKGDVDFDSVYEKASFITPVPGGVGPMTIACLLYTSPSPRD